MPSRNGQVFISADVLYDRRVSHRAFRLFSLLVILADEQGNTPLDIAGWAARLNHRPETISRYLDELVLFGHVTRNGDSVRVPVFEGNAL